MALFHRATLTPSKPELLKDWVPKQRWCPNPALPIEPIGAFRFDDPEGEVGLETHLVRNGHSVLNVPLTYRPAPLPHAEDALVCEMHHSALGTRWVYDGLRDARMVLMLAASALTGQGEALGMVEYDGAWHIAPASVRIRGGGWGLERISVDGLEPTSGENSDSVSFRNDRFDLTVHRHLSTETPASAMALEATWDSGTTWAVLADVADRAGSSEVE